MPGRGVEKAAGSAAAIAPASSRGLSRIRARALAPVLAAVLVAGCAKSPRPVDLAALYREAAAAGAGQRNPLVVMPGTAGSRLVHGPTGELVWGGLDLSADPESREGFERLALPIGEDGQALAELRDDIRPGGLLDAARVSVFGAIIERGIYDGIVRTLQTGGYTARLPGAVLRRLEDGLFVRSPQPLASATDAAELTVEDYAAIVPDDNSVLFDYDWRRDLVETAATLYRTLKTRRQMIMSQRGGDGPGGDEPVKFDLIAHSMGGLAARYFLLYGDAPLPDDGPLPPVTWKGAELVDKVVIVGAPHGGSVIAFENLINGKSFSPLTPEFQAELLGTHPSVYQLLPRDRHKRIVWSGDPSTPVASIYDVELWDRYDWGLLSPEAAEPLALLTPEERDPETRRARVRAHLARLLKRAQRFHAAIDRPAELPPGLDPYLVVGSGFETPAEIAVDPETGEVEISGRDEGDGVVLRASVLLDERVGGEFTPGLSSPLRWRATLFLLDEHVELIQSEVFGDNLLFWLLEEPRRQPRRSLEEPQLAGGVGGEGANVTGGQLSLSEETILEDTR